MCTFYLQIKEPHTMPGICDLWKNISVRHSHASHERQNKNIYAFFKKIILLFSLFAEVAFILFYKVHFKFFVLHILK